jgi:hypothetical protein
MAQISSSDSVYLNVGMVGTANSSSPILSPSGLVSFMSREIVLKISSSLNVPISDLLDRSFGLGSGMEDQLNPSFCAAPHGNACSNGYRVPAPFLLLARTARRRSKPYPHEASHRLQ